MLCNGCCYGLSLFQISGEGSTSKAYQMCITSKMDVDDWCADLFLARSLGEVFIGLLASPNQRHGDFKPPHLRKI